jgi:hypothetical protein
MAITAAVAVAVVGTTVQHNQQKIAAQKQQDAVSKPSDEQNKLIDEQKKMDEERKAKEDAALKQAFVSSAAKRNQVSGANLPGAVPSQAIGSVSPATTPGKTLIGS